MYNKILAIILTNALTFLVLIAQNVSAAETNTVKKVTQAELSQGQNIFRPTLDEINDGIAHCGEGVYIFTVLDPVGTTDFNGVALSLGFKLAGFKKNHPRLELETMVAIQMAKVYQYEYRDVAVKYLVTFREKK